MVFKICEKIEFLGVEIVEITFLNGEGTEFVVFGEGNLIRVFETVESESSKGRC